MTCLPHYCTREFPKANAGPWLSQVADKPISEITFPGTHDSGCRNDIAFCQTHTYSIYTQLMDGVRFLDIRCRHIHDTFAIHHGLVYCGIVFGDVLNDCVKFLNENPSEAILMRVQEEYKEEQCTRSFQDTFRMYYAAFEGYFSLTSYIPNLKEIRRKIWIMPNFDFDQGYGWNRATIQDNYVVENGADLQKKVDLVKTQCERAINGDSGELFINFCSGVGYICWPYHVAKETNKLPMSYSGRMGIVVMDFPGEDAVMHLIKQNY